MNATWNEGLSFCLPKWKKFSFLGYMEIWICPATSLLLHVQFVWGNILDHMCKKLPEHCSCLQDLAIKQFASGSRQLLSTCGRNPRWKVLTLWLGQQGKSWALAVFMNEALNSGCGTALYNEFCWTLTVKSAFFEESSWIQNWLKKHFWMIHL